MAGYVIDESAVEARANEGDTALTRVAIDASCGCERLEQRVIRFVPGRSLERVLVDRQELLYVAAGSGTVFVNGEPHALEPDMGVYLTPGDRYSVENPGPAEFARRICHGAARRARERRSRRHGALRRPADPAAEDKPRVPLPRRPRPGVRGHHAVRGGHPTGPCGGRTATRTTRSCT